MPRSRNANGNNTNEGVSEGARPLWFRGRGGDNFVTVPVVVLVTESPAQSPSLMKNEKWKMENAKLALALGSVSHFAFSILHF